MPRNEEGFGGKPSIRREGTARTERQNAQVVSITFTSSTPGLGVWCDRRALGGRDRAARHEWVAGRGDRSRKIGGSVAGDIGRTSSKRRFSREAGAIMPHPADRGGKSGRSRAYGFRRRFFTGRESRGRTWEAESPPLSPRPFGIGRSAGEISGSSRAKPFRGRRWSLELAPQRDHP